MRQASFISALALAISLAPAAAQVAGAPPPAAPFQPVPPASQTAAMLKAASIYPGIADSIVAVAVTADPARAAEIAGDAIAALPPVAIDEIGPRIAAAVARVTPSRAAEIAGSAAEAAAYAAGKAAQPKPGTSTMPDAAQATLTASATASVSVVQAVIVAVDQFADAKEAAEIAGAITEAGIAGAMRGTAAAAWEAARNSGGSSVEAQEIADETSRLVATNVARGAIEAALSAHKQAASTDMAQVKAVIDGPPETAAQNTANAVLIVASGVTKAAVAASLSLTKDEAKGAPIVLASRITDAAVIDATEATRAAASAAAARAGAFAPEADRLGADAAAPVADTIGDAAAQATLATVPLPVIAADGKSATRTLAKAIAAQVAAQQQEK